MKKNLILNGILILSFTTISLAFFIEYFLNHKPCNLCIIERLPYFAALFLLTYNLFNKKYEKIIIAVLLILFFVGVIVSIYHVGIEKGIFQESFLCNLENKSTTDKTLLLNELKMTSISCKVVTFRLLGLSLATINTLLSFIISVSLFRLLFNYEHR